MGRGRAKAKQTKVARELKYNAPRTDLEALQAELSGQKSMHHDVDEEFDDDDDYDPYSKYIDDEDEEDGR
ncbi:MAG: DUF3073 domain-containing protein [Candidatus Nanopelagicales bacterium]